MPNGKLSLVKIEHKKVYNFPKSKKHHKKKEKTPFM